MISAAILCSLGALSACNDSSSGSSGGTDDAAVRASSLDATISGLNSPGLVLMVNVDQRAGQSAGIRVHAEMRALAGPYQLPCPCNWNGPGTRAVSVPAEATIQPLADALAPGTSYAVTIQAQPAGETCSVEDGTGTIGATRMANVLVSCSDQSYTVGGSITGLTASSLVLLDNGGDALTVGANATQFTMKTPVSYGSQYAITVQSVPPGLVCAVGNGAGTMGAADITGITISCAPNFTLLYSFAGGSSDGAQPYHNLIQAADGNFYGTTQAGGPSNGGGVFEITPSGAETFVYSFAEGVTPFPALAQGDDDSLYGTTAAGGTHGLGMVFKMTPSGAESVLYSFAGGSSDGKDPFTGVIQGSDGDFYGTTYFGGPANVGTIFKVTPTGSETVLHSFAKTGGDGYFPYAGLIQGSDGNLYGTTYFGGTHGLGTVFEITPSGTESVLYSFAGGGSDGEHPYGTVVQGTDGNFYGTTEQGGASGHGTVFKVTPDGTETVLYSFTGSGGDGADPQAGLTLGRDGNFYGATYQGGSSGLGTIFEITPTGVETVLHSFAGGSSDGANDWVNLVQASDGNLYGSTYAGGSSNNGTFFKVALQSSDP